MHLVFTCISCINKLLNTIGCQNNSEVEFMMMKLRLTPGLAPIWSTSNWTFNAIFELSTMAWSPYLVHFLFSSFYLRECMIRFINEGYFWLHLTKTRLWMIVWWNWIIFHYLSRQRSLKYFGQYLVITARVGMSHTTTEEKCGIENNFPMSHS